MSPESIGICGLLGLLALLGAGVPIAVAMGLSGAIGLAVLLSPEAALVKSGVLAFHSISNYDLGVLPLFVLMAHVCFAAGATQKFFEAAAKFIGHRPGGLLLASIAGCAGFGAISGSSLATAATVGLVALPEMRKHEYAPSLATGALAAGGTLGVLIPPSGALIVFGIIAEQSIGKLFLAALIPGITQALFYMALIFGMCSWKPALAPASPRATWRERRIALFGLLDISLLSGVVLGGFAFGWFTPTEAASVGTVGAFALCAARGKLNLRTLTQALSDTLRTTGMIYAVIIGAHIFSAFISTSRIPGRVSEWVVQLNAGPTAAIVAMAVVLLILGSFLDGLALMLLATPVFLPIAVHLGLSPIWFGIFLVRAMEIGFVHPPVGMNVYVIHGLAPEIPLTTIFRGILPFLGMDFLHLALLIALPQLTLWLPTFLGN
ncbi:MAG TPA: TRAP transporter large permease [Polyangiales bacterium]|nr:TRAP transporter large permease [Polyangiales bacterium]